MSSSRITMRLNTSLVPIQSDIAIAGMSKQTESRPPRDTSPESVLFDVNVSKSPRAAHRARGSSRAAADEFLPFDGRDIWTLSSVNL